MFERNDESPYGVYSMGVFLLVFIAVALAIFQRKALRRSFSVRLKSLN